MGGRQRLNRIIEKIIVFILFLATSISVIVTFSIIYIIFSEAIPFFKEVSIIEFLTDTQWTPLFTQKHYGILPLLVGTLLTSVIALAVAIPAGITIAVFLNEYVSSRVRNVVKPIIELLALVPTVVYGYFALLIVTPALQKIIPDLQSFNALSAGLVMGMMILPMIASLTDDAIKSVPRSLREAAYGLGATRFQTAFKVLIPAASYGIVAAIMLAIARAFGETMIVTIAAGQFPILTFDPRQPVETITAYIVQVTMGDVPHDSLEYRTVFAAALVLFILTSIATSLSFYVRRKMAMIKR
ncbi:MAG: phosphate ABC transporter permease subunit PstC [Chlorobi bacterium]|nr:phosphate ABC transporter permease subunit PstC [Chlorobiota bacterium]